LKLDRLHIRNIRNIEDIEITCARGIHFIYGLNAQGKTSILESIYLLSNLRSFRDSDLSALLKQGQEFSVVNGKFKLDETTTAELKVELVQGPRRFEKRAYINGKLTRSSLDYFGVKLNHSAVQFHAINLNPTSTDLIRGEPALRRNYLNQVVSSESLDYMHALKVYQKALDQKNALLKAEEKFDLALLNILNETLVKTGAILLHGRLNYLRKLSKPVLDFLSNIAPLQRPVNLVYRNGETLHFTGHFEPPSVNFLEENLHQKLTEMRTQERVRKSSLVGPHRDDLMFKVGDVVNHAASPLLPDLVNVGSQGEIRSLLLSLKLAELEAFKAQTRIQPVLLIDDFSSELDSTRRGFLLNYLKNSELQIFVTSTDDLSGNLGATGTVIEMQHGSVKERSG
jgi:DNA replication and repair protein RecF